MPPRTSSRSGSTRDQASSPPKKPRSAQSQSPVGRRTRSARSRSIEQPESLPPVRRRRAPKKAAREGSHDSIDNNPIEPRPRRARRLKRTRAAIDQRELPTVTEDPEPEPKSEEDAEVAQAQRSQSPGALSQMSGTTAITSASARTSHSVMEIASLGSEIAEMLPSLCNTSFQILKLLAPDHASEDLVESIIRDLKVPGSKVAKRLKNQEEKFRVDREAFGSDDYIKTEFILRRLLGSQNPEEGPFRPDAIIYAANLATLVKTLLASQRESPKARNLLSGLTNDFPWRFVRKFSDTTSYGDSTLDEDSFEFALDIRTQLTIVCLGLLKDQDNWNPEELLSNSFYKPPFQSDSPFSSFEDAIDQWQPKNILTPTELAPADQIDRIHQRASNIYSTFRIDPEAIRAGDLVDFEALEKLFPWLSFVTSLVQWCRSRLYEISQAIDEQDGVENITRSLIATMRSIDSDLDISFQAPPSIGRKQQPLPPAEIIPAQPGKSFLNPAAVRLVKAKKQRAIAAQAPSTGRSSVAHSHPNQPRASKQRVAPSSPDGFQQAVEDFEPTGFDSGFDSEVDGDHVGKRDGRVSRPDEEYNAMYGAHVAEKNKENRPVPNSNAKSAPHWQPGTKRSKRNGQETEAGLSTQTLPRQTHSESRESEDEAFQDDLRKPDPSRRIPAQAARSTKRAREPSPEENEISEDDVPSPPKRARTQGAEAGNSRRHRHRHRPHRNQSPGPSASDAMDYNWEDDDDANPAPTFTQVAALAKTMGARARSGPFLPQKRRKWTQDDEDFLVKSIEEHGCCWAFLSKLDGWGHDHDQVALKDKARNMKVAYIKASIDLPYNFEYVPLGKKEIATIRRTMPDYEYDLGSE